MQRERLLRAAASEFAERGFGGASSESISRRLGVPCDVLDLAPVIDRLILGLIPADQ